MYKRDYYWVWKEKLETQINIKKEELK